MSKLADHNFSRRERQIMDVLYQRHRASAADIRESLPNAPSYSAVRALLRILEEKGHIRHEEKDLRYVYFPAAPRALARRRALWHLVETFFDGSAVQTVATLLDPTTGRISGGDLDHLARLIAKVRKSGG
jgi:predicted transcriptional regulator